jgi:uncharacterized protein involved in cysteine biosynthesis
VGAFIRGFTLILTTPKLWRYIWLPMVLALLVYGAILAACHFYLVPRLISATGAEGWLGTVAQVAGRIGFSIAMWFLAAPIYLFISGLFSSFMWEALSRRVEQHVYGTAPETRVGCATLVSDSVLRVVFAAGLFVCGCACFFLGPIPGFLVAAVLSLLDFSCPAFLRRGVPFPQQIGAAFRTRGSIAFAALCGIVSFLPFVFVLALPMMVAGATMLVRDSERR